MIKFKTNLWISSIVIGMSILIPFYTPFKLVIPPASYILFSYVPVFLALYYSRRLALSAVFCMSIALYSTHYPLSIVAECLSHLLLAIIGSTYIKNHADILSSVRSYIPFCIRMACLVALGEMGVSMFIFFIKHDITPNTVFVALILVGGVALVHSFIDGMIGYILYKVINKIWGSCLCRKHADT